MASSTKRSWRLQEFVAHASNVNCLALGQKSGRVLVTGGDDKKVNLWAVGKQNCIMSLTGHTTPVECVKFGISEELVCAGSQAGALKIWDLEAAKIFRTLTGHKSGIRCIDFHPYGDFLTTGSLDNSVRLWDIRRKGCIYTYSAHKPRVNSVKFSPDGQWVASAGEEGVVKLWDLRIGRLLKEFTNHGGPVTSVAFHPNEFLLASTSVDRTVNFWDLERFQLISSTDVDVTGVRCAVFSEGGECLFAGSQDRLKVYGWEPTRTLDSVPINWGKIQDIAVAQNQLIGASFHTSMVVINVVDLKRVQPFGGTPSPNSPAFAPGQSVRKSFSRPKQKDTAKLAVKTIEESDRSGTDPEDDSLSLADIQSVGDYREIFQPNRKLCRTPPPEPFPAPLESLENDPSLPQILQSPHSERSESDVSIDSQGLSSIEMRESALPVVRGLNSFSNVTLRTRIPAPVSNSTSPTEELSSFESIEPLRSPTREDFPETWNLRRQSSGQPQPAFPEVDFPVKLSSIRHSPSEPALNRPYSSNSRAQSLSRPNLNQLAGGSLPRSESMLPPPPPAPIPPSRPPKRTRPAPEIRVQQPVILPKEKDDEMFIPMAADRPSGLDLDEFLPRNYSRSTGYQSSFSDMSESEVLTSIVRGHEQMMAVLGSRQQSLQIVYSVWMNKDMKTAVESALAMNNKALIVDLLDVISVKSSNWTLELCSTILPSIGDLLQSKFEMYMTVGCNTLRLILRNFAAVIKTNVQGGRSNTYGVDISAEERYNRCKKCYDCLLPIRAFLLKRQTMQGKLGQSFRELSALMENLD